MTRVLLLMPVALIAGAASAQTDRSIPMGNPLGDRPIVVRPEATPDPAAEALLRARRIQIARARQIDQMRQAQMWDTPKAAAEEPELRARPAYTNEEPTQARTGPLPTPFGGGIRTPWDRR